MATSSFRYRYPIRIIFCKQILTLHTGAISPRGVNGAERQAIALQAEGVVVETTRTGQFMVHLRDVGWFPDSLPDTDVEQLIE